MSTAILRCVAGELPILSGSLRLPTGRVGSAVIEVHSATALPELSPASIVLTRENLVEDVFVGAVRKSAVNDGTAQLVVTVVQGRGLLAASIPARDHAKGVTEIPVGLLVAGIVADAGEQLAPGVEAALDRLTVPHWHRVAGPASSALDLLASLLGLVWRVLPSGLVWVGVDTFPAGPDLRRLTYELEDGGRLYGPDGGQVLPGQLLEGALRVTDVVYMLGGPVRAEARGAVPGDPQHVPDLELYRRTWGARVVAQDAATGLLDVVCDDIRMDELRGVALRCGIPGARITYQAPVGERVRIAFEGADPRLPYAEACDQASGTVHGVAREGDAVGYLSAVCAAPGAPAVLTISPVPLGVAGEVKLVILSGSPEVSIR